MEKPCVIKMIINNAGIELRPIIALFGKLFLKKKLFNPEKQKLYFTLLKNINK